MTLISGDDRWLFSEGSHSHLYEVLGCQPLTNFDDPGRRFGVWAPNAIDVWVIGDFNQWESGAQMIPQESTGIWAAVVPNANVGDRYKFRILTKSGDTVERADPLAFASELPPATASVVTDLRHRWTDAKWMDNRASAQAHDKPISIYEMHAGSWRHTEAYQSLSWPELAEPLADYLHDTGFTHVELMPVMEYPFYGSWGYQTTGYFAPTARFGLPSEFMGFVDALHRRGIGVILDWVPSHFPSDDVALANFDGSPLYEHADPREGWHPDWKSHIFNYGRHEVRSFLISSAMNWIHRYHIDGIRVDAVASMLYRDYSRNEGEWIPNEFGGRENLEAVKFLQDLNVTVGAEAPGVLTIAEESTDFPGVTRPVDQGGLGFHYKWDMGWMHDTLQYLARDPIHRRFHHHEITFRSVYAFSENYVLGLSHDEVTHGKGSLLAKMPGDQWEQFANLRLLYGNQWLSPGKKLLFMGQEFAQGPEWNHDHPIAWSQRELPDHKGVLRWVTELNRVYREEASLHERDTDPSGFEWIVLDDGENSVLAWLRTGDTSRPVLCVMNLTPVSRDGYRLGVPTLASGGSATWDVLLNSGAPQFSDPAAGRSSNHVSTVKPTGPGSHGRAQSLSLDLPPLSVLVLAPNVD